MRHDLAHFLPLARAGPLTGSGAAEPSSRPLLPQPLRHLANQPRGRYRLGCTVTFSHRRGEWLDRVEETGPA